MAIARFGRVLQGLAILIWMVGGGLVSAESVIDAQSDAPSLCPTGSDFTVGTSSQTLDFDGLTRRYTLYIPDSYDGLQPVPLVFSFHGFASYAEQQAGYSRWNTIADRENFIVIYPQGTGFPARWYSGVGLVPREQADDVDDVGFIKALLTEVTTSLCIDPARIFVTGLSNGGGMSYTLACQMADQIAAVGTVAGAYTEQLTACEPTRPLPVISFHGKLDPIVPYEGTDTLESFQQWGMDWATRNGCDDEPETFSVIDQVSGQRYVNCTDNAEVLLYTIADGGHTWPGEGDEIPAFVAGKTSKDIDASETMWTFFLAHPLPAEVSGK